MKIFGYALLGLLLTAPAQSQYLNPPTYEWRDDAIALADKLEVRAAMRVMVLTGSGREPRVSFQGPEQLLSDAMATVEDGTLTLAFKDDKPYSSNPGSRLTAAVYLPNVSEVSTGTSTAQIEVFDNTTEQFSADIGGAGRITVKRLEAKRVNVAIGGAGKIRLEGTADEARYAIGGAGSIEAKRLRVATAEIAIGGAGSVYADVSRTAEISVDGAGRIEIVGGAKCTVSGEHPMAARKVECR